MQREGGKKKLEREGPSAEEVGECYLILIEPKVSATLSRVKRDRRTWARQSAFIFRETGKMELQ